MQRRSAGTAGMLRELAAFSLPLISSAVLQQLYNWADALIVGNAEGELALGAIGGTGTVTAFLLLAVQGLAVGVGVLAAQLHGSGDTADIRDLLSAFAALVTGVYLALAALGALAARPLLTLIGTPAATLPLAADYLRIVALGLPFLALFNLYSAVVRAVGDSKSPFRAVLLSSVVNICLDLLLVVGLHLGVKGAAIATVLSQALMAIDLAAGLHRRHPALRPRLRRGLLRLPVVRRGFALGLPPMLQSSFTSLGSLLLQAFMNSFSAATVIAITTAYRIDTLTMLPVVNTGAAISTLTGQRYGARDAEGLRLVRRAGLGLILGVSALLTILVIPFGPRLIALFGAGAEAVAIGRAFFLRLASFYLVFGGYVGLRGCLEGVGDVAFTGLIAAAMLVLRLACSYGLAPLCGNMVIAWAEAICWVFGCAACALRLYRRRDLQSMPAKEE